MAKSDTDSDEAAALPIVSCHLLMQPWILQIYPLQ